MSYHLEKRARMEGGSANEVQRKSTSPKKICNLSTQSFSEIIHVAAFVDKTLFIKAFLEAHKVIVTLAPRRFGKSTNMDMVKEFLTGNKKLFQDNQLKIWKEERFFFYKYCQENPVIHVDFRNITGETEDGLFQSLKDVIHCAFNEHKYLVKKIDGKYSWSDTKLEVVDCIEEFEKYWKTSENLSRGDVIDGLKLLSHCLHVYHNKLVYVLIDEFDSPIMNIIVKQSTSKNDVLDETIYVIGRLMSITFKNNKHLNRGLINACVPVAEQVLSSDANNIQYYQFLRQRRFAPYFGFTDTEVKSLFEKEEFATFNNDQVKKWYNGYKLVDDEGDYAIYSCYSVLKYLSTSHEMKKPCFDNYWVDSACITHLKHLFGYNPIRKLIEYLIDGEEIEIKAIQKFAKEDIIDLLNLVHQELKSIHMSDAHLFLQLLTENGYLNVLRTSPENQRITIRIPNEEIRMLLRGKCYDVELFSQKHQLLDENIEGYLAALESVLTREDKNVFKEYAKAVSKLFDGAIMPQNEDEFHSILFVLAYNVKDYIVRSELSISRTKSQGRPPHLDLHMILNEAGLIVELKFADQSSAAALSQIRTRQYESSFDNYKNVTKKILMGLHMTKEGKVSLTYTIGDSPPETVTSHE
ncbi:uncharacterized protein in vnfD 5'region-like isoform X3 [Tenebrio molitor]